MIKNIFNKNKYQQFKNKLWPKFGTLSISYKNLNAAQSTVKAFKSFN